MSAPVTTQQKGPMQRKWWVLGLGAAVCVLCWIAMGLGLAFEVGFNARVGLVTLAAVSTEGLIWLAALVFGMRAFEVRRHIMQRIRGLVGANGAGGPGNERH